MLVCNREEIPRSALQGNRMRFYGHLLAVPFEYKSNIGEFVRVACFQTGKMVPKTSFIALIPEYPNILLPNGNAV